MAFGALDAAARSIKSKSSNKLNAAIPTTTKFIPIAIKEVSAKVKKAAPKKLITQLIMYIRKTAPVAAAMPILNLSVTFMIPEAYKNSIKKSTPIVNVMACITIPPIPY